MNERDKMIFSGKLCPYCDNKTELVDTSEVYGENYSKRAWMYLCRKCGAYVGTHPKTTKALGRLADANLRNWKKLAHHYFDALWKQKMKQGLSKTKARALAYQWLSNQLGMPPERTHIGMFDVVECKSTVQVCEPYAIRIFAKLRAKNED